MQGKVIEYKSTLTRFKLKTARLHFMYKIVSFRHKNLQDLLGSASFAMDLKRTHPMKTNLPIQNLGNSQPGKLFRLIKQLPLSSTLLVVVLLFAVGWAKGQITVSGSDCARVNGTYNLEQGSSNDERPMYSNTADLYPAVIYILHYDGAWRIFEYPEYLSGGKGGEITHYINYSSATTPPCSGWESVAGCSSTIVLDGTCESTGCTSPVITASPKSYMGFIGEQYDLVVSATGSNINYEWQESSNNADFTAIPGTNVNTIGLNLYEAGTKYYRCKVSSDTCTTISATASVVSLSAGSPLFYTASVTGLSRSQVVIPVGVQGFDGFQTLQGNVSLPSNVVAKIDSVVSTNALTQISGLAGDIAISGNTISFSYDNLNGSFSFADKTILFNIYARLIETAVSSTCTSPTDNGTPHQWGKLVNDEPVVTTPNLYFGQLCVEAATQNSIRFVNMPNICAGSTDSYFLPFEAIGSFDAEAVVNLYINNAFASGLYLTSGGVILSDKLPAETVTLKLVVTDGTTSNDYVLELGGFEKIGLTINGETYNGLSEDPNTFFCPGTTLTGAFVANNPISWSTWGPDGIITSGSSKTFEINNTANDYYAVNYYTSNANGCLSPDYSKYEFAVMDKVAPTVTFLKTSDTLVIESGASVGTYDLTTVMSYTDNCGFGEMPVTAVHEGIGPVQPEAVAIYPGKNNLSITVTDINGLQTTVDYVVYGAATPVYTLSFEYPQSVYGGSDDDIVKMDLIPTGNNTALGEPFVHTYQTMSGKINLGNFAKEVRQATPYLDGTLTYTFENGILSYTATNIQIQDMKPVFSIIVKPNMAAGAVDENYTPTHTDAVWITEYNRQAVLTSNFAANTLRGLAVIQGEFVTANGTAFTSPTFLLCDGCIKYDNCLDYRELNTSENNHTYSFRAIPGATVSLTVQDWSGIETSTAVSSTHVINNRRYILNQIALDEINRRAGDVDNSGGINTLDVLQQRQNIVGDRDLFRNNFGVLSAFNYVPYNTDNDTYPSVESLASLIVGQQVYNYNFLGLEIGVVNSVPPKSGATETMSLSIAHVTALEQSTVKVPVIVTENCQAAGLQFTVQWNQNSLELSEVSAAIVPFLQGKSQVANGNLMLNWIDDKAKNHQFAVGDTLLILTFLTNSKKGGATSIEINSAVTRAMGSDEFAREVAVVASPGSVSVASGIKDLGNGYGIGNAVPNPFIGSSYISFVLPNPQALTFTVYNNLGQFITETKAFDAGANSWVLPTNDKMSPGVYFISLQGQNINQVVKVVKL